MTPTEPITERDLAERIGVARHVLRAFRHEHLEPETHFLEKKAGVTFTEAGLALVLAALEKKEGAPAHDVGAGGPISAELGCSAKKEPRRFWVARLVANGRVLLATPDRERRQPVVTVRVRDSRRYAVGMEISAIPAGPVWQIFGPPPRRRSQRSAVPR